MRARDNDVSYVCRAASTLHSPLAMSAGRLARSTAPSSGADPHRPVNPRTVWARAAAQNEIARRPMGCVHSTKFYEGEGRPSSGGGDRRLRRRGTVSQPQRQPAVRARRDRQPMAGTKTARLPAALAGGRQPLCQRGESGHASSRRWKATAASARQGEKELATDGSGGGVAISGRNQGLRDEPAAVTAVIAARRGRRRRPP